MKINYTLPGLVPETDVGKEIVESFDSPFKNRMEAFERKQPVAWRDLLGLNRQAPDPSQVAAPPPSNSSEAAAIRQQWRDLLGRHASADSLQGAAPPVQRMMRLLATYQKESDRLFSMGLAETER